MALGQNFSWSGLLSRFSIRPLAFVAAFNGLCFLALLVWIFVEFARTGPEVPVVVIPAEYVAQADTWARSTSVASDDPTLDDGAADDNALEESAADESGVEESEEDRPGDRVRQALHVRASEAVRAGNIDQGIEIMQRAIASEPLDPVLRQDLGTYYIKKEMYPQAIAAFLEAIRLSPDYARAYFNLGTAYLKSGHLKEAIESLNEALALRPFYGPARYNLAQSLKRSGDIAGAIENYQKVTDENRGSLAVLANYNLGLLRAQAGQNEAALDSFLATLRADPDHMRSRFNKAIILTRLGRSGEARAEYEKILQIRPDYDRAAMNKAVLYMRAGQFEAAEAVLSKLVQRSPDYAAAHYNLGLVYRKLAKAERAIEELQRAVRLSGDRPEYHYNLGLVLSESGRRAEAISAYQTAMRLRPNYYRARYNLALNYYREGRYEESLELMEKARAQRPDSYEATYNAGLAALKLKRLREAEERFRAALILEDTLSAHYNLGLALTRHGKAAAGLLEFETARRIDPKHQRSLKRIAEIRYHDGDHEGALRELRRLQDLNPNEDMALEMARELIDSDQMDVALRYLRILGQGTAELHRKGTMLALRSLVNAKELNQAEELAARAAHDFPEDPEVAQWLKRIEQIRKKSIKVDAD